MKNGLDRGMMRRFLKLLTQIERAEAADAPPREREREKNN
jgi:hypothetical protein